MQLCAISIVIFATLVIVKILFPGWIKKYPLIGAAAIFIDIGLLILIASLNLLVAAIILMTVVVFIALWSVLCVIDMSDNGRTIKSLELDQSTLKSSKKSLTNGAAILSVISCYTTANGMKDVVFGGWLAYPASIAVQVTLAFFKLFPFKIYPCCTNFKLAESRREDCELCISTSSNRIPDNVLTVQLLVYCYKRVRKNTE